MFKIGSLSDQGWINDPLATLNYILVCYLLTDASQSLLFDGNVISLSNTYQQYINEPDKMATAVSADLNRLISRHFPQADILCRAKQISGAHYAILISASAITENNERIELARVMEISTANLRKIIQTNNYGDAQSVFTNL
jgi:hypothetical protein